mmetsp:Transcript_21411/g.53605  ORF Transcript_21411/g.53605 Transcript_21411/m.53605 type:complete len:252 (+) Transcript_21411:646-1401(+)
MSLSTPSAPLTAASALFGSISTRTTRFASSKPGTTGNGASCTILPLPCSPSASSAAKPASPTAVAGAPGAAAARGSSVEAAASPEGGGGDCASRVPSSTSEAFSESSCDSSVASASSSTRRALASLASPLPVSAAATRAETSALVLSPPLSAPGEGATGTAGSGASGASLRTGSDKTSSVVAAHHSLEGKTTASFSTSSFCRGVTMSTATWALSAIAPKPEATQSESASSGFSRSAPLLRASEHCWVDSLP